MGLIIQLFFYKVKKKRNCRFLTSNMPTVLTDVTRLYIKINDQTELYNVVGTR